MSRYLPIENLIYTTQLSKEQALAKLTETIIMHSAPYTGMVVGDAFEIRRAITYRNSFLPIIKGEVIDEYGITKIKVSMKPHSFVLVFMAIWFGGVFLDCIATVSALFTQKFTPFSLIPFGMLLFGVVLVYGGFKAESSISKKDLKRIFEAEIE